MHLSFKAQQHIGPGDDTTRLQQHTPRFTQRQALAASAAAVDYHHLLSGDQHITDAPPPPADSGPPPAKPGTPHQHAAGTLHHLLISCTDARRQRAQDPGDIGQLGRARVRDQPINRALPSEHYVTLADHGWIAAATYATEAAPIADHHSGAPAIIRHFTAGKADLPDRGGASSNRSGHTGGSSDGRLVGHAVDNALALTRHTTTRSEQALDRGRSSSDQYGHLDDDCDGCIITSPSDHAHPVTGSRDQVGDRSDDREGSSIRGIDGSGVKPSRFRRTGLRDRPLLSGFVPAGLFTIGNACTPDIGCSYPAGLRRNAVNSASEICNVNAIDYVGVAELSLLLSGEGDDADDANDADDAENQADKNAPVVIRHVTTRKTWYPDRGCTSSVQDRCPRNDSIVDDEGFW